MKPAGTYYARNWSLTRAPTPLRPPHAPRRRGAAHATPCANGCAVGAQLHQAYYSPSLRGLGTERLKREFQIPCGISGIARILRSDSLVRPPKRKHHTKRCLQALKAQWSLFGQLVADTKYLQDILNYWQQMQRLGLPRFQYTVREPVSGLCFVGYADELSKSYAVLLAQRVCEQLAQHGVNLRQLEWQTDNGAEFMEDAHHRGLPGTVCAFGSAHHYIPPKAYT